MKRIIFSLFIVFALCNLVAKGTITFDTTMHDFKDIKEENGPHEFIFHFTNTGNEDIKIESAKAG